MPTNQPTTTKMIKKEKKIKKTEGKFHQLRGSYTPDSSYYYFHMDTWKTYSTYDNKLIKRKYQCAISQTVMCVEGGGG